jgi:hypothetical protein
VVRVNHPCRVVHIRFIEADYHYNSLQFFYQFFDYNSNYCHRTLRKVEACRYRSSP